MTDFTSPEIGNKRLANCVFLQTSDLLFWDRLMLEIQRWWDALGAEARAAIKTQRALRPLQAFKGARSG